MLQIKNGIFLIFLGFVVSYVLRRLARRQPCATIANIRYPELTIHRGRK